MKFSWTLTSSMDGPNGADRPETRKTADHATQKHSLSTPSRLKIRKDTSLQLEAFPKTQRVHTHQNLAKTAEVSHFCYRVAFALPLTPFNPQISTLPKLENSEALQK